MMIVRSLPACATRPGGKRVPLPDTFTFAGPRSPVERVSLPSGRRGLPASLCRVPELRKLFWTRARSSRIRHVGSGPSWENPYHPNTFYHRKPVRYLTECVTPRPEPHPCVTAPSGRQLAGGSGKSGSPWRQGVPVPAGCPPAPPGRGVAGAASPHPSVGRHRATPPRFGRIPKPGQYVLLVIVCPPDVPSSYSWQLPRSIQVCALPSHCPTVSHPAETFPPTVSTAAESARSAEPGNHVPGVNQRTCAP